MELYWVQYSFIKPLGVEQSADCWLSSHLRGRRMEIERPRTEVRGLRWVTGRMSDHDRLWLLKVVREQGCVIVEPRREVLADFALEYWASPEELRFVGYSLFVTANGVYQHNLLLSDEEIACRVGFAEGERRAVEAWLLENIVPHYTGPLGIDYLHTAEGNSLSELNLRHTMGFLAHEWLRQHPAAEGAAFSPSAWMGR